MSDTPTPAEIVAISNRVNQLTEAGRDVLLMMLVGRMCFYSLEELRHDIESVEDREAIHASRFGGTR